MIPSDGRGGGGGEELVVDDFVGVIDFVVGVVWDVGGLDMDPNSPWPLSQETMLTPTAMSSLRPPVLVAHVSEMPSATARAGVTVLAQLLPVVSQPITSRHVVVSEAQDVVGLATQRVRQELKVLVVHSSELGSTLLGSLESVKSVGGPLAWVEIISRGRWCLGLVNVPLSLPLSSSSSVPGVWQSGPVHPPGGHPRPKGPHPPPWLHKGPSQSPP